MAGVDQQHGEAARFEQFVQGYPVHARGLHGHGVHGAGVEPIGQTVQIGGKAGELAHGLVVAVWRYGHEVCSAADVDTGGIGVGQGDGRLCGGPLALCHGILHHEKWNVAPARVRRLDHSLKRDVCARPKRPGTGSPMSMTQPMTTLTRGQFAPLLLRSLPVLRSTLPYSAGQRHVFLRDDLRRGRADYFANPTPHADARGQRVALRRFSMRAPGGRER
ncbi:MAG: hypothetical protein DDT25_01193 [Chloroflexi bacterium]|nr:hypothetical protein [Chloroflexota bacterium]